MTVTQLSRYSVLLLGLAAPVAQGADSHQLLTRIQRAAQQVDYEGVFVYQHGDQLESLRIFHKAGPDGIHERLLSLNGVPREIIRTNREVRCYLPDEKAVMVEHRRADRRAFPALLPDKLSGLSQHYKVTSGKGGRVAGRSTKLIKIRPKDGFRYGFRLWADEATGLLLKASLLEESGGMIEQYMFTQITIGKPIPEAALEPENRSKELVWHRADESSADVVPGFWEARRLPPGFVQTTRMMRHQPADRQPVEHLVYSDGLAVISVFIEPSESASRSSALRGLTQMGAVHAYGKIEDGHQITVVGEAPAATVDMIGASVSRLP